MVFLPFTAQSLLYLLTRIFFWPLRCILFPCYCTCCLVGTKLLISPLTWMIISSNVLLQVASVTFDLLLLLVLGSYLIILFTFLVITTRVPSLVSSLFIKLSLFFECKFFWLHHLHNHMRMSWTKKLNFQWCCLTGSWRSYKFIPTASFS